MKIDERIEGDVAVLKMSGELMGGPDFQLFKDTVYKLLEQGILKVVVDLSRVKRMNSSGLGILISGYTSLTNKSGTMVLASVNTLMKGVLVKTKLDTIFTNYDSVEAAIADLK